MIIQPQGSHSKFCDEDKNLLHNQEIVVKASYYTLDSLSGCFLWILDFGFNFGQELRIYSVHLDGLPGWALVIDI